MKKFFKEHPTFSEQEQVVKSLPPGKDKELDNALDKIEKSEMPLNLKAKDFPQNLKTKITVHKKIDENDSYSSSSSSSDSDSDKDQSASQSKSVIPGVSTSCLTIGHGKEKEKSVVHIKVDNKEKAYTFSKGKDGLFRAKLSNRNISDFEKGLKKKDGITAITRQEHGQEYPMVTTFSRSSK